MIDGDDGDDGDSQTLRVLIESFKNVHFDLI